MKSIIVFIVYFAFGALVASMANAGNDTNDKSSLDTYHLSVEAKQARHANDFLRSVYKDRGYGKEKRQAAKKTAKRI